MFQRLGVVFVFYWLSDGVIVYLKFLGQVLLVILFFFCVVESEIFQVVFWSQDNWEKCFSYFVGDKKDERGMDLMFILLRFCIIFYFSIFISMDALVEYFKIWKSIKIIVGISKVESFMLQVKGNKFKIFDKFLIF